MANIDKKSKKREGGSVPSTVQPEPPLGLTKEIAKTPFLTVGPSGDQGPSQVPLGDQGQRELLALILDVVRNASQTALKAGVPARDFLNMVSAELRPYIEEGITEGYATPEEGIRILTEVEGGCAEIAEASMLYHKPNGVSRQALSARIAAGDIIAYQTGSKRWVLPRWQFRPEGGLLKGLPEVLKKIRNELPNFGHLFPFTFFLQADPICDGRTPLEALRAGELEKVLLAVDGHKG